MCSREDVVHLPGLGLSMSSCRAEKTEKEAGLDLLDVPRGRVVDMDFDALSCTFARIVCDGLFYFCICMWRCVLIRWLDYPGVDEVNDVHSVDLRQLIHQRWICWNIQHQEIFVPTNINNTREHGPVASFPSLSAQSFRRAWLWSCRDSGFSVLICWIRSSLKSSSRANSVGTEDMIIHPWRRPTHIHTSGPSTETNRSYGNQSTQRKPTLSPTARRLEPINLLGWGDRADQHQMIPTHKICFLWTTCRQVTNPTLVQKNPKESAASVSYRQETVKPHQVSFSMSSSSILEATGTYSFIL